MLTGKNVTIKILFILKTKAERYWVRRRNSPLTFSFFLGANFNHWSWGLPSATAEMGIVIWPLEFRRWKMVKSLTWIDHDQSYSNRILEHSIHCLHYRPHLNVIRNREWKLQEKHFIIPNWIGFFFDDIGFIFFGIKCANNIWISVLNTQITTSQYCSLDFDIVLNTFNRKTATTFSSARLKTWFVCYKLTKCHLLVHYPNSLNEQECECRH